MKKLFGLFGLLICGCSLVCGGAEAGRKADVELNLDRRFLPDGGEGVLGWALNPAGDFKPFGQILPVMVDGVPGVRLVSRGKHTAIFSREAFAAGSGERFRFTCGISGSGRCAIGFYMYGDKWRWRGAAEKTLVADSAEPREVSFEVTVNASEVRSVCPVLSVESGAVVTFSALRCVRVGVSAR